MKRYATFNDVKVYNVSAGKSLPEWTEERAKNNTSLRYNEEYRRRIELISDFDFPTASTMVQRSPDGQYIFATGTYPPRMKIFETAQLGLKCERYMDADAVKFEVLSDDYQKLVFLRTDRQLEFHVKYGKYYTTRLPRFGRDLSYSKRSCELYCACSGPDVYRLHLEQGRYLKPFETKCPAINAVEMNLQHQLLGCAGADGRLECWDQRQRVLAGELDVVAALAAAGEPASAAAEAALEVTALQFAPDGLTMSVGTSGGQCLLFDLRSSKPMLVKRHNNALPIVSLTFAEGTRQLVSADPKLVKIWDRDSGDVLTNIEPPADINHVCLWPGSGLLLMAAETRKIQTFYVPAMGVAPRWCRFLDNLTEELEEEEKSGVYDDYKFVTETELKTLGLERLVGTNTVRAYMHGYFMDTRLYRKAKAIAKPFEYETYKEAQIQKKIDEERENRIAPLKKLPKVNRKLAERMQSKGKSASAKKQHADTAAALMGDNRFSALWNDPNFVVDERSDEFARLNPSSVSMRGKQQKFDDDDSDVEKAEGVQAAEEEQMDLSAFEDPDGNASDDDDDDDTSAEEGHNVPDSKPRDGKVQQSGPRLLAVKHGHDGLQIPLRGKKTRKAKNNTSFGERLVAQKRRADKKEKTTADEKQQRHKKRRDAQTGTVKSKYQDPLSSGQARRSFDQEMRGLKSHTNHRRKRT